MQEQLYPIHPNQSTFRWPQEYKVYQSIKIKKYDAALQKAYFTVRTMQKAVHIPASTMYTMPYTIPRYRTPKQLKLPGL